MEKGFRLVAGILILGVIIAFLTAQPEAGVIASERVSDTRSDIFFTYTTISYPSRVAIVSQSEPNLTIGINVDTDKLDFGIVPGEGGTVKRQINLTTRDGKNSRVHAKARGSIAPMITFDKNDFLFNGKDVIHVTFDSMNYPVGNYTGEISVIIQRTNNDLLRYIVGY